jgi:D-alanine-D-alanine ligase
MMNNMNKDNIKSYYGNVAVLMGGTSAERDISLLSGSAIYEGLKSQGINVVKIDTQENLYQSLQEQKIDRAFIALHGRDGEDGVIQGYLRMLKIPFTGSDTASSALAMNKVLTKKIWCYMGLKTAEFSKVLKTECFDLNNSSKLMNHLGRTLFVKPIREGSSVGMSKTSSESELVDAVKKAQKYDDVLIEQFIDGDEFTISIINKNALPSIQMVTPNEFYDYEAKYTANTTEYYCPSGLTEDEENELQSVALKAFSALGCSGWGRIDFIRDKSTKQFMLLEANTVPGMTESSLVPKAASSVGISFPQLVKEILDTSFKPAILGDYKVGTRHE